MGPRNTCGERCVHGTNNRCRSNIEGALEACTSSGISQGIYTNVLVLRDVPYATFEKELVSSATNLRASLLSMPLVLAKKDY